MESHKEKIDALIDNSNTILKSANQVAETGDFGTATSLLVTSFEEKTKAVVLQILELGFPIIDKLSDLDYIFKHHDGRHYIGFFIDCFYEIIDDLKKLILHFKTDKNYIKKLSNFTQDIEVQNDIFEWGLNKIKSFSSKIDFYQNIERKRQAGLYIDVLNNNFKNQKINKIDFLFVKERLQNVHDISNDLLDFQYNKEYLDLDTLNKSKESLENVNFPFHLVKAIELVKKERSKAFNILRKKLMDFRDEMILINTKD